jgi:hypothetical protein
MKSAVFWDVVKCVLIIHSRVGGTCRLHLQGRRNNASYRLTLFFPRAVSSILKMKATRRLIINSHGAAF